jgi:hypothetical protein
MGCFDNIEELRESVRFQRKENTIFARDMYSNIWQEYINLYGIRTEYHVYGYSTTDHDFVYGEHPTASYNESKPINMILEFQSDALLLSKFGIETNADLIAMVSVKDYRNTFGIDAEPKSGDVLELVESAWQVSELPQYYDPASQATTGFDAKTLLCEYKDPEVAASIIMAVSGLYGYKYVRVPQLFEITEVKYQDFTQTGMNLLQGHYVWKIHAKRFDYSFENGIDGEAPNQQVYDNDFFGALSGSQTQKPYDQTVDSEGKKTWDYEEKGTNSAPYGYY